MKNKKFISVIWGYHKQIFLFDKEQNYHMLPIEVMKEEGYECEIFAIDSQVHIEDDPNFIFGTKVIYYENIIKYLYYIFTNRKNLILSNSLTIKTLLIGLIGKNIYFTPHSHLFGNTLFKKLLITFFYKKYNKIRINNEVELQEIEKIKPGLGYRCSLAVSKYFFNKTIKNRKNYAIWIGNLTNIKNPEFLINTCNLLKKKKIKFKIKVIGEDRYMKDGKNFQDLIQLNNLNGYIKLLGVKNYKDIKTELSKSLIYINTSTSEGQCLAVYEGSLAGNILCLPNILSFYPVFKDNAFYHNNASELSDNIIKIIEKKDDYLYMVKNNQKLILESYNYTKIKNDIKNMFIN